MSAHTPGPWAGPDENGKFNSNHAWTAEDDSALSSESAPVFAEGKVVALVVHSSNRFSFHSNHRVTANARLIAASPDLLAALEAVKAWDISNLSLDVPLEVRQQMQAAIAKATGGAA